MTYEEYCKLRDFRGMTDYAVSKAAKISRTTLSHWKNGFSEPSRNIQERLERFFSDFEIVYDRDGETVREPVAIEFTSRKSPGPEVAYYFIKLLDGTTVKLSADEYKKLQEAIDAFTYAWVKNHRTDSGRS